jgi:D-hexose-6-phosphate mutarotase
LVEAGESLRLSLTTHNRDARPFTITEALHSYFAVREIGSVGITGLEGCGYTDQLLENRRVTQDGVLRIDSETDRIYASDTGVRVAGNSRILTVEKSGSRSTVVWNPWKKKAARLADFGDTEYREMLCVETANAGEHSVTIQSGGSHTVTLEIGEA